MSPPKRLIPIFLIRLGIQIRFPTKKSHLAIGIRLFLAIALAGKAGKPLRGEHELASARWPGATR